MTLRMCFLACEKHGLGHEHANRYPCPNLQACVGIRMISCSGHEFEPAKSAKLNNCRRTRKVQLATISRHTMLRMHGAEVERLGTAESGIGLDEVADPLIAAQRQTSWLKKQRWACENTLLTKSYSINARSTVTAALWVKYSIGCILRTTRRTTPSNSFECTPLLDLITLVRSSGRAAT